MNREETGKGATFFITRLFDALDKYQPIRCRCIRITLEERKLHPTRKHLKVKNCELLKMSALKSDNSREVH